MASYCFFLLIPREQHAEIVASLRVPFGFRYVERFRLINNRLGIGVIGIGLNQPGEFDGLDDVDELLRTPDAGICPSCLGAAGMVAVEEPVFLADDVGYEGGSIGLVLLVGDLDGEVAAEAFGLGAGLVLAQLLGEVKDVLREAHNRHTASPAGLLKEIVAARDEILKLVLP